jgi:predicted O-methyltransferase YrrM
VVNKNKVSRLHPEITSSIIFFDVVAKNLQFLRNVSFFKYIVRKINSTEFIRISRRRKYAKIYYVEKIQMIKKWSNKKTENFNYYYDITEMNRNYLISALSIITKREHDLIKKYFLELRNDQQLRDRLNETFKNYNEYRDSDIYFGRREVWYALIRILKPKLVVETGVYHGLGAVTCSLALKRNRLEKYPGKYIGIDNDFTAGKILNDFLDAEDLIIYKDAVKAIDDIDLPIDFFINDSNHDPEFEKQEYEKLMKKEKVPPFIISDNSHISEELAKISFKYKRNFIFLPENPKNHWYPGAGVGISFIE